MQTPYADILKDVNPAQTSMGAFPSSARMVVDQFADSASGADLFLYSCCLITPAEIYSAGLFRVSASAQTIVCLALTVCNVPCCMSNCSLLHAHDSFYWHART